MTSEDDLKSATTEGVARASQAGHEAADAGSDALPNNAGEAFGAIRSGGDAVARRVKQQPVEALLLASAVGYLVGWAVNLT